MSNMNLRVLASFTALLSCSAFAEFQSPLDEQWVLTKDRTTFLKNLTPDTDDYFFYHALHQQHLGLSDEFRKTMQGWQALYKNAAIPGPRATQLRNRQTLLDYEAGLTGSDDRLRSIFGIQSPKTKVDQGRSVQLPSELVESAISHEIFVKRLGLNNERKLILSATGHQLSRLAGSNQKWSKQNRDMLLRKIDDAGLPNIEQLITANFEEPKPLPISQIRSSRNLSQSQLRRLAQQVPKLLNDQAFVALLIHSMQPDDTSIFERDPQKHLEWLAELDDFTSTLPSAFDNLKVHVLYHRLRIAADLDTYSRKNFERFLKFPRRKNIIWRDSTIVAGHAPISLDQNYLRFSACSPIRSESALIEGYLDRVLSDRANAESLRGYFHAPYFVKMLSRAQLLAGIDAEKLDHDMNASEFESLRDLKELNIASSTSRQWGQDSLVALNVDLKNIETLTVSIYALDSLRYAQETGKEIGDELDLSSMAPNISRSIDTKESPFLRHRRVIELSELSDVGSWLVELHGNGQRATALIHKGELHHSLRDTGDGQEILVTDFSGSPLKGVKISSSNKEWITDDTGTVKLPYLPYTAKSTLRLHLASKDRENGITRVTKIERKGANTSLELATISHPEQWLADQQSTFYYKPSFLVNGQVGSLERIKSSQATLTATLNDGQKIELARVFIKVSINDFLPISFTVPKNLSKLELTVSCELKPIAGREASKVSASKLLAVTATPETKNLAHHYFYQVGETWYLRCLGRNGEPWPNKVFALRINHRDFTRPITHKLITDDNGTIMLGRLNEITRVSIQQSSESPATALNLAPGDSILPLASYYTHGKEINLITRLGSELNRYDYSLRGAGSDKKDYFSSLSLKGNSISCGVLPVGKYTLKTPHSRAHTFEILEATAHGQWLTAQGQAVELTPGKATQIVKASHAKGKLNIKLSNSTPYTRIHLIASQFSETTAAYQPALPETLGQSHFLFGFNPSIYTNGGTLSGEHQYILNRRLTGNQLGNMLERPAWHLRPWQTNTSESFIPELEASKDGRGDGQGLQSKKKSSRNRGRHSNELGASSPIDFIENKAVVIANLTPNKLGEFSLSLNKLVGHKRVDIIITQANNSDSVTVSLPKSQLKTSDKRLAKSLDISKQFRAGETHAVLTNGATTNIENVVDADWKAYSTLSDVYSYLYTHVSGEEHADALRNFAPILNWPELDQPERLELLENIGSHELHLFIKNRDPQWFSSHIAPMLENKRRKDFLDHYLLDRDLSSYTSPGKYRTLNTIEQSLLAESLQSNSIIEKVKSDYLRVRPGTEAESELFTSLLKQGFNSDLDEIKRGLASQTSNRRLRRKLEDTIIPVVDLENVTVSDAINFLRQRLLELDSLQFDSKEMMSGVSFVIRNPTVTNLSDEASEFNNGIKNDSKIIDSLQLRNAPAEVVLKQICDKTHLRYKVENGRVVILPATDFDDTELYTRSFNVPADLAKLLSNSNSGGFSDDPFAEDSGSNSSRAATPPIKDLLQQSGIVFPEGATASFNRRTGKLIVRNTANNLDIAESLTMEIKGVTNKSRQSRSLVMPSSVTARPSKPVGKIEGASLIAAAEFGSGLSDTSVDSFADEIVAPVLPPLVEPSALPHETKAYAESYYYKRQQSNGKLNIIPNEFWLDLAKWDGKSEFLSPHFAECRDSVHEALVTLALLDLPFEAIKPDIAIEKNSMRVTAKQAMILYYRDLKPTVKVERNKGLLSSIRYFRSGDILTEDADGKVSENSITGKFQTHTPYEAHLILTNPTGVEREVDILRQIPSGAIRLDSADDLSALRTRIPPHGGWKHVVYFYFPTEGSWPHYSPRIHEGVTLVSQLEDRTLEVADTLPKKFSSSWRQMVAEGSDQEILQALKTNPLQLIEVSYLDEHMANAAFYEPAIKTLNDRMVDSSAFVSHSIKHRDMDSLTHYLGDSEHCTNQFGYYFKTQVLDTTPYSMNEFEDTEWRPLINARSFSLTTENRIGNEKVWADYLKLLTQLAWKSELGTEEKLTLAYHLFLHDRNIEAMDLVSKCEREDCGSKMQFDYLTCYIHFLKGEPEKAKGISQLWVKSAKEPWRKRFLEITTQANQIANNALLKPHENADSSSRSWAASLTKGNILRIEHKQMEDIVVQVYPVDLELLFSNSPFLDSSDTNYKAIRPLQELTIKLDKEETSTEFKLPEPYQTGNHLLVIDDGEKDWLHPLQSTKISTTVNTGSGLLQAISEDKPVSHCYVKIYVLSEMGNVEFLKDGHTDLRGMFDYRSHNVHSPADVQSYAIFISHPDLGCITKIIGDARPNTNTGMLPTIN